MTDWHEYFKTLREQFEATHQTHEDEPKFAVTTPGHEVTVTELPGAPKKIVKWLQANENWQIRAQHSRTHHRAEIYADNSKTGLARKGDVKTPERDKDHWAVQGLLATGTQKIADFWAAWDTVNGKTTFLDASHWDRVTQERFVDTQAAPFEDWLRILAPAGAPGKRPPRKSKADTEKKIEIIEIGEWQG